MAKKSFKPLLGISSSTWLRIDAASTVLFTGVAIRKALQMIGEHGVFGRGKSKSLENLNFGASNKTWNHLDTISTALVAFVLLHGAIDTYEEVKKIPDAEQLMPGRGIVYSGAEWIDNVF